MLAIILTAFAVPPQAPPLEDRVKILEAKVAALELKAAKTPVASEYPLTPSVKTADAPTEFFPPGTTMVCGPNGCLVPSAAPTSISYPGGPFGVPVQPVVGQTYPGYTMQSGNYKKQGGPFSGWFGGGKKCGPRGCN
jgi:hypothetical protein